jgi:dihydrodipicolinate synthase/N-acetylneuraminate lyase
MIAMNKAVAIDKATPAAVDAVGDRASIVAGTGTYDTRHSAHLTARADELGVDGFLAVTPYYNKPPQRAIVRHFEEIAAATDKPVVVYNIPSRVIVNIEPATIAQLAEIASVTAVKQAHDDLDEARFIAQETLLDLYSADDNITFAFLELGAVGVISVASHVWGQQIKEMIVRHREGARKRQGQYRHRRIARAARAARPRVRPAEDPDEPDSDQGGAQSPRPQRRRLPAADGGADRGRAGAGARVPRTRRRAPTGVRVTATRLR